MQLHIQYLTDDSGSRTAVQIPFKEWQTLSEDYRHLKECFGLQDRLGKALRQTERIRKGKLKSQTLNGMLNEL